MKNEIKVMDASGDSTISWDPEVDVEVKSAKKQFGDLKSKGYIAYKLVDGRKGSIITEFDPSVGGIIMRPPITGG